MPARGLAYDQLREFLLQGNTIFSVPVQLLRGDEFDRGIYNLPAPSYTGSEGLMRLRTLPPIKSSGRPCWRISSFTSSMTSENKMSQLRCGIFSRPSAPSMNLRPGGQLTLSLAKTRPLLLQKVYPDFHIRNAICNRCEEEFPDISPPDRFHSN